MTTLLLYYRNNNNNPFETIFGLLIMLLLYLFFRHLLTIIKFLYKCYLYTIGVVIGIILELVALLFKFIDTIIFWVFIVSGFVLSGSGLKQYLNNDGLVIFLSIVIWLSILLVIRYYFKIILLKFKLFQLITDKIYKELDIEY